MALLTTKKSYANFKGKISGLHNRKNGSSRTDYDWGSKLQFFIKTSEYNSVAVDLISFASRVGEDVYISTTDRNTSRETKAIDWESRNEEFEGWQLIGLQLRGKNQAKISTLVEYDAIDYILNNFEDDDVVFVQCEVERSISGEKIYTNYKIRRMYSSDGEFDITADDFQEVAEINDTFAFKEMAINESVGRASVRGVVVYRNDKLVDVEYVIGLKQEEDLAIVEYIKAHCKFGDVLTIDGIVHNRVIGEWVEKEGKKNLVGKSASSFGGGGKRFVIKGEQREIQIIGIADLQKSVYTEEDLTVKEFDWLA